MKIQCDHKDLEGMGEAFVFIVIFFYFKNYYNFRLYFHILLAFTVSEIWVYFTSGVNKGYKFLKTSELIEIVTKIMVNVWVYSNFNVKKI